MNSHIVFLIFFGISIFLLPQKILSDEDPFAADAGIRKNPHSKLPPAITQSKSFRIKEMFNLTGNVEFSCRSIPAGGVNKTWTFPWGECKATDNGEVGSGFVLKRKDTNEIVKSNRAVRSMVVDSTRAFALYGGAHLIAPHGGIALIENQGDKLVWREILNTSSGIPIPVGEGWIKTTENAEGAPVFWFAVVATSGPKFLIAIGEDGKLWIEDVVKNAFDGSIEWEGVILDFISGGDAGK
jgi:hypothetical protein